MMLNRPSASVTTERTFSMRAGLAASTDTPGRTASDVSLTTPAMALACCAHALDESRTRHGKRTAPMRVPETLEFGRFEIMTLLLALNRAMKCTPHFHERQLDAETFSVH